MKSVTVGNNHNT